MKKVTKIILPIASVAAIAAPVATLVSCSKADFNCNIKIEGSTSLLKSKPIDVVAGKKYTVSIDLKKIKITDASFTGYHLGDEIVEQRTIEEGGLDFDPNLCQVRFDSKEKWREPETISGQDITGTFNFDYIEFTVGFKKNIEGVYLLFQGIQGN